MPLGYRNLDGPDGKKIIAPDPGVAPIISKLFDWYATGRLSLKEAAYKARDAGLVYRKSGAKVPVSTVHSILRNRIYTGWFEWNGKMIQGRHERIVGACAGRDGRPLREEAPPHDTRLRLLRTDRLLEMLLLGRR